MAEIGRYLVCVCAAAILCGVIKSISISNQLFASAIKLLCGIFITIVVISPWKNVSLLKLPQLPQDLLEQGKVYGKQGEDLSREHIGTIIKEQTQAYILEKAYALNAQVEVSVEVSDGDLPVPVRAYVTGNLPYLTQSKLSAYMAESLGIAKENQVWNEST